MIEWLSSEPAKRVGLSRVKGQIQAGFDGDIVIWKPHESREITADSLQFKNKVSPYVGCTLYGIVTHTFSRGRLVYDRKKGVFGPYGKLLNPLETNS